MSYHPRCDFDESDSSTYIRKDEFTYQAMTPRDSAGTNSNCSNNYMDLLRTDTVHSEWIEQVVVVVVVGVVDITPRNPNPYSHNDSVETEAARENCFNPQFRRVIRSRNSTATVDEASKSMKGLRNEFSAGRSDASIWAKVSAGRCLADNEADVSAALSGSRPR